jgi:hypothetical protein
MGGITLTRKVLCGLAILGASYVVAGFSNSSPITQPALHSSGMRGSAVVILPAPPATSDTDSGPMQAGTPEGRGREFQAMSHTALQEI